MSAEFGPTGSPPNWSAPGGDLIRQKAGLPPATYFSGGKLKWVLDHIDGLWADAERGDVG